MVRIIAISLLATVYGCASATSLRGGPDGYAPPAYLDAISTSATSPAPTSESETQETAHPATAPESVVDTEAPTLSEPSLAGEFTLAILLESARERSPRIEVGRQNLRAARTGYSQVAMLDDVLKSFAGFTEGQMSAVGKMKNMDPVTKKFPPPGVSALKSRIIDRTVDAALAELAEALLEVEAEVRGVYWNLCYVVAAQGVLDDTLELLERLDRVTTTLYETGKTSFQDVIRVRIRKATTKERVTSLERQRVVLERRVRELLNLSGQAPVGSPAVASPFEGLELGNADGWGDFALTNRPMLKGMKAGISKMELMIELAETMTLPPYTLNLSVYAAKELASTGSGAKKSAFPAMTTAKTGAGLPKKPWFGMTDAYIDSSRAKLASMKAKLEQMREVTLTMVASRWFELDRAVREARLNDETVVSLSQAALDVAIRGYESGKLPFADLIASYSGWLEANLALARKRSDVGIFAAELERAAGSSFYRAEIHDEQSAGNGKKDASAPGEER